MAMVRLAEQKREASRFKSDTYCWRLSCKSWDRWRELTMPNTNGGAIPLRQFGRHEVKISAVGFGGHHLGDAPDQPTAERLVRQAVDGGITFFDNCWEYHRGKTEA